MKLSHKLVFAFLIISTISAITGLTGIRGIAQVTESFDSIVNETTPELIILGKMDMLSQKIQVDTLNFSLFSNSLDEPIVYDEKLNEYAQTKRDLEQAISNFEELDLEEYADDSEFDDKAEEFIAKIHISKENLYVASQNLIDAIKSGEKLQDLQELNKELEKAGDLFSDTIQRQINKEMLELDGKNINAIQTSDEFTNIILVTSMLGVVTAIFFGLVTARSITNPIEKLEVALKQLHKGNYDDIIIPKGDAEIKNIIQSFNVMAQNLYDQQQKLLRTEKLYTIGKLASRLAHDLRNPMAIIQGTVEILNFLLPKDKEMQLHLSRMNTAISRMTHQIENVLDYVRNKSMKIERYSISKILDSVLDTTKIPEFISVEKPVDDFEIDCDPNMLKVVFVNLIMNAIQAIGDEKGRITIRIFEKNQSSIAIQIEDSGPGISLDVFPRIFEPLFTTKQEGTGLGLASCNSIVEQHGGTMDVKNHPTTFTITMPKKFTPLKNQ